MQAVALLVGFGGLVLIGISVLWPAPNTHDYWSPEDEAEYTKLHNRARSLAEHRAHSAEVSEKFKQEFKETEEKLAKQRQKLDSGRTRSTLAPSILRWLGIFTTLGGFGWLFSKRKEFEDAG